MIGMKQLRAIALVSVAVGLVGFAPARPTEDAQTLNIVDVYCLSNGASWWTEGGTGTCQATVTGGTGVYSYSWEPQQVRGSGGIVRIPCILESWQNVILTVTDSGGATDTFTTSFYCGEAP